MGAGLGKAGIRDARQVFLRIYHIHRSLERGKCPSLADLARDLEVSPRTVERDIQQMRDQHAPLVYDRQRGGYRYEHPYSLPPMRLAAGELAVLLIGQRLLAEMAGTPFAEAARQVMEKLPLVLGDEVSVNMEQFGGEDLSFGVPPVRGDEDRLESGFHILAEAITHRRAVSMTYHTLTRDVTTERRVDPYHLRLEAGAWYVIGHCHTRGEVRIFAVDRIANVALTDEIFTRPADFSIEKYLDHSWSMERGVEYRVRVAFDHKQARFIRERVWQEGQQLTDTEDGGVVLEIRASGLTLIKQWILGFGGHVTVLEPDELIGLIREEINKMKENY